MTFKRLLFLLGFALLMVIAPLAYQVDRAAQSLPPMTGDFTLAGLSGPATVTFDALAIPGITARSREDAYRVLGYLHARDRLFQMDLLRRKSAGRLAEALGAKALPVDRRQRVYQFSAAATTALTRLPEAERAVLVAYAEGVNAAIRTARELPPEFRLLRYRPEAWQPADSLLVAAGMFQTLTDQEADERMLTVMKASLPAAVYDFLTPETDDYSHALLGGPEYRRPARPVPAAELAQLLEATPPPRPQASRVDPDPPDFGSNNWAVNGAKTTDGRAILADDMHLALGVPNIWYRARLRYAGRELAGVTLPGLPLVIAGSNAHIAWGFTNLNGDVQDLVSLETDPGHPGEYLTPAGWKAYDTVTATLAVRDGETVTMTVRNTLWGPVLEQPLLGRPVALRWTALDPAAVNLRLLDLDDATTLEQAMPVFNRFGAPPQNVLIADDRGRIAWTYAGFIPQRQGHDGSVSVSWADGAAGWRGYLAPEQLPRLVDPPEGYLATANNQLLGSGYPQVIGHNFANGYRAFRIRQRLAEQPRLSEADLQAIQLDTTSDFYAFYRQLALPLLTPDRLAREPDLADAAAAINAWNGRLDADSLGIALLARWREDLARAVFSPLLGRCTALDPRFSYRWREQETPLRALLSQGLPGLAADWEGFLRERLRSSASALKQEQQVASLMDLPWRRVNTVAIRHPFSRTLPAAGALLDMTPVAGACNSFCVKVLHDQHGASERLVLSPNHPEDGLFQMPGGQSGHPLSPHFRDQQAAWTAGLPTPFLPGPPTHTLTLRPAAHQPSRSEAGGETGQTDR